MPVVLCGATRRCQATVGRRKSRRTGSVGGVEHGRRKGSLLVGQVSRRASGRWSGRFGALRCRNMDLRQIWRAVPAGHVPHQYHRRLPDRRSDDPAHRAVPAAPELAAISGRRRPGWIHNVLQLRVRDISGCTLGSPLDRARLLGRERSVRVSWRVVGRRGREWSLIG